jgi:hypothetical protein
MKNPITKSSRMIGIGPNCSRSQSDLPSRLTTSLIEVILKVMTSLKLSVLVLNILNRSVKEIM